MDPTDADLAARLAEAAGRLAVMVRDTGLLDGEPLGEAGDAIADRLLCRALHAQRRDDGLLSEESGDARDRLGKRRVWIVDPVDGTREYREGRSDWAVHVGLAVDGVAAVGAVALPDLGLIFRSDRPAPLPPPGDRLRIAVSRTRPPPLVASVAARLDADLVPMGSAGAKAMAVIRGEADLYLHAGGQHEWDSCAPVAVALAHGLHCSRLDGSALIYNRPDPAIPDLVVCRRELAERVLAVLR